MEKLQWKVFYVYLFFSKRNLSLFPLLDPFETSAIFHLFWGACFLKKFTSICNVRQSALQKFLKISIKNSKCATSNKHIQDGRPGRYENRRGSKIKAKRPQKTPTHHPGTRMPEMSSPRRRESQEFCHPTAKRQGFGRKVPNETIVPRR